VIKLNYISEIILPSKSAYSVQVMKMCDAFSKKDFNIELFVLNRKTHVKKIYKTYNCSKKFEIRSTNITNNNFIGRLRFAYKIIRNLKKNGFDEIYYSRSVISGILLSFYTKNVIIEIHHSLKGFTFILFSILKNLNSFKNIKFIFISKDLEKLFNLSNKTIVLDDAVDLENFNKVKSKVKINKTCVYTGSFSKGKGLETIIEIARLLPDISFHLYGDLINTLISKKDLTKIKNIAYMGYVDNRKIPKILSLYNLYMMPYSNKVFVRSKNIEVSKYMSPLKLFEYLASDGVLFASDMKVYKHILNQKNCVLIKDNSINEWAKKISIFFKKKSRFKYLSINASKVAKKNTWNIRVEKIKKFINVV
tara:strand:- start:21962 stop:23053 length:1092 start_codon:yes stop_codon:yes gene_type:complete